MTQDLIDPLSPIPRYLLIAAIIRARIERGELEPGRPIPSRNTIHQQYGVAGTTVHRALRVLVDEGLVVVVPGLGARVVGGAVRPGAVSAGPLPVSAELPGGVPVSRCGKRVDDLQ